MLIALALDVLAAWLISRSLVRWWAWVPAALLAGAFISLAGNIAVGLLGFMTPGHAVYAGLYQVPLHAGVCSLYCLWLVRRRSA